MAVTKTEIFIASRFNEFAELRTLLAQRINQFPVFPLQAVDLNDGVAGSSPPLGKCIAAVKRAEVMILLVGDTYGGTPQGHDLSYTHLEYRTAVSESSQTVLLPFFISKDNVENNFHGFSADPKLSAWQKEIMDNHTPAFLDAAEDPRILCQVIFDCAYKALYDSRTNAVQQQMDLSSVSEDLDPDDENVAVVPSTGDDSLGLSHTDMERLDDAFHGEEESIFDTGESNFEKLPDILQRPAEIASLEQKREAFKALELGDRFIAIQHFRKARDYRPLDFSSTYWLARLLVASGKTNDSREAIRYSLLAAKMANYDQRPVKAAASYIIAAKAASKIEEYEEALEYAKKAVEETPWLATARIELASQLAGSGQVDEAFKEVRKAFVKMPQIILKANREPSFVKLGKRYQEFKKNLRESLLKEINTFYKDELAARQSLSSDSSDLANLDIGLKTTKLQSKPLLNLYYEGRQEAMKQLAFIEKQAAELLSFDDKAIDAYYNSKVNEHESRVSYNSRELSAAISNRNAAILQSALCLAPAIFCFYFSFKVTSFLFILGLILCAFAYFSIKKFIAANKVINESKLFASSSLRVKSEISEQASQLRQLAALKVPQICSAILAFEKHVMQSMFFSVGKKVKGARTGDIVAIDSLLQAEILKSAIVDDSIVPQSLMSHVSEMSTISDGRIKLYRLVGYKDGKPVLSRWSVYFGALNEPGYEAVSGKNLGPRGSMRFDYQDNQFIHVICPQCGRGSKINKSNATFSENGFKMKGLGQCTCGFSFDRVESVALGNAEDSIPGMISTLR